MQQSSDSSPSQSLSRQNYSPEKESRCKLHNVFQVKQHGDTFSPYTTHLTSVKEQSGEQHSTYEYEYKVEIASAIANNDNGLEFRRGEKILIDRGGGRQGDRWVYGRIG